MKAVAALILLFPLIVCADGFYEESGVVIGEELPVSIIEWVANYEGLGKDELSPLEGGVVYWGDSNYIAALVNQAQDECRIYSYQNGSISPIFLYPNCSFLSGGELSYSRRSKMPDVVFRMQMSPDNVPGPVQHYVVAVYDQENKAYCESQQIASWYQVGVLSNPPAEFDVTCPRDSKGTK